jgi:hypothetical protein
MGRTPVLHSLIRTLVRDFVSIMCEPAGPARRLLVKEASKSRRSPRFLIPGCNDSEIG